jgi:hypothetical protein
VRQALELPLPAARLEPLDDPRQGRDLLRQGGGAVLGWGPSLARARAPAGRRDPPPSGSTSSRYFVMASSAVCNVEAGEVLSAQIFLRGATSSTSWISMSNSRSGWARSPMSASTARPMSARSIASLFIRTAGQPSFHLEAPQLRVVAEDDLVSVDTKRYSGPSRASGSRSRWAAGRDGRDLPPWACITIHPRLPGKHQLRILPKHGAGAIARLTRQRRSIAAPPAIDPRSGWRSKSGTTCGLRRGLHRRRGGPLMPAAQLERLQEHR